MAKGSDHNRNRPQSGGGSGGSKKSRMTQSDVDNLLALKAALPDDPDLFSWVKVVVEERNQLREKIGALEPTTTDKAKEAAAQEQNAGSRVAALSGLMTGRERTKCTALMGRIQGASTTLNKILDQVEARGNIAKAAAALRPTR